MATKEKHVGVANRARLPEKADPINRTPVLPDLSLPDPLEPVVDDIVKIIKLNHPHAAENLVNLGPANISREVLERRAIIARLRLRGIRNQSYIAEALGVGYATVANDNRALDRTFAEQAVADVQAEKGIDFLRIELAVQGILERVEQGSLPHIQMMVTLLARKAKLLGLDAPAELSVINWREELSKRGVEAGSVFDQVVQVVSTTIARRQVQDARPALEQGEVQDGEDAE